MSKKHFISLADVVRLRIENQILARVQSQELPLSAEWICNLIESELADFCQSQNRRFNRERWLGYIAGECGPNGGTIKKAA